jgi:hypothetical protein
MQLRGERNAIVDTAACRSGSNHGLLPFRTCMNVLAQSPSPGPSESSPDLSDQKLSAAAAAIERVASLQQEYRQRVAEAEAPADKDRIVAEANNELTQQRAYKGRNRTGTLG